MRIRPGETVESVNQPNSVVGANPGRVIYVSALDTASRPDLSLRSIVSLSDGRIRDFSGTEIPVVSENEFRTGRLNLLFVSLKESLTSTLRVYSFEPLTITARFFELGRASSPELAVRQLRLTTGSRYVPAYGELTDFPHISQTLTGLVRVELTADKTDAPFWAFVTSWANDTQSLSIVSSQ
ncbi:MAG TPA: hypothetical protein VNM92_05120 [Thermoanaerobaculia bacterium]|nr:hypothetical protein [Thermoanaerobaculia bacterium]